MNILMSMERQEDRLEEIARNYMTFGDLTFHQYCEKIDQVTSEQINRAATLVLAGKPTMLVTGGAINPDRERERERETEREREREVCMCVCVSVCVCACVRV